MSTEFGLGTPASRGMGASQGAGAAPGGLRRELGLLDVVLFNVAAMLGLRWLSAAAAVGPSALVLWGLAFLLFFVPQGLTVIELSSRYPEEGGIYRWTQRAFGDFHGFIAGWCYWTNNLVYFPSLLIFGAGIAAFIGGQRTAWLGDNPWFVGLFAFTALWLALGLNLIGMHIGKWVQNLGAIGTWVPGLVLILLGGWAVARFGSATPVTAASLVPAFDYGTMSFWSLLCFGFAGFELAPLMAGEIRDPRRNLPRAIVISGALIAFIYVLGTGALMAALPHAQVNIITGVTQAVQAVSDRVGVAGLTGVMALLITLGNLGGCGAWLAGSARIPYVAGIDRYLPEAMGRLHPRWGTPHVSILVQGGLASLFLAMGLAGSAVQEAYQILAEMTVIVYFIPYLYLFAALPILRRRERLGAGGSPGPAAQVEVIPIPGGGFAAWLVPGLGFATTLFSIGVSFIPSQAVDAPLLFLAKVVGGCVLFVGTGAALFWLRRPRAAAAGSASIGI